MMNGLVIRRGEYYLARKGTKSARPERKEGVAMKNIRIRKALKEYGVRVWELAELLNIAESTLCRHLRKELPAEEQDRMIELIRQRGGRTED